VHGHAHNIRGEDATPLPKNDGDDVLRGDSGSGAYRGSLSHGRATVRSKLVRCWVTRGGCSSIGVEGRGAELPGSTGVSARWMNSQEADWSAIKEPRKARGPVRSTLKHGSKGRPGSVAQYVCPLTRSVPAGSVTWRISGAPRKYMSPSTEPSLNIRPVP
jgi:hypothetical protein